MISIKLIVLSLAIFGSTLAMPVKRFDSASLLSSDSTAIAGFATSTGAPPSTATNSPAVDTCQSAAHEAIGATEDACGQLDALYDGTFDNLDPELLATAACKSASAAAVTAIVNTCGQALGVDVSGKSATELTAADFPQNQAGFNTGRSEAASITLCAQATLFTADAADRGCGTENQGVFRKRDVCGDAMAEAIGLITSGVCSA